MIKKSWWGDVSLNVYLAVLLFEGSIDNRGILQQSVDFVLSGLQVSELPDHCICDFDHANFNRNDYFYLEMNQKIGTYLNHCPEI